MRTNRTAALLLVAGGIAAGFGYLWALVAGRFMSRPEYADFTAGVSILYFIVIASGPLSQSVAYFVASARDREEALTLTTTAESLLLRYGGAVTILFVAASPLFARVLHFQGPLALAGVFVSGLLFALLSVRRGLIQGQSRFVTLAVNTVLEATVRLVAIGAAYFWLPSAPAGIATYAASILIAVLVLPFPHAAARCDLRPLLRYLLSAFGATAVYAAFLNSDVVLVKLFFPAADAAIYGAASFLARASAMLVAPFYVFAVPHLVEARSDVETLRRRFTRICAQYSALAIVTVLAIALLRRQLVALFLGPGYVGAAALLVPLSVAIAIGGLTFIAGQLPMALGMFRFLPSYAAAYVLEIVAIAVWHQTMARVVYVLIAAQTLALLLMAVHVRTALVPRTRIS